jgi:ribosomal subunit interface protein
MNINIKATNFSLTDAINDYVGKRLDKIAKMVQDDPSAKCDIELGRTTAHHNKGDIFRAEIHIVGASGLNTYAAIEREDLYAAVDEVRDAIVRDLTSTRKKQTSRIRRGGARIKQIIKGLWPGKNNY